MVHIFELKDLEIDRDALLKIARVFADEEGTCLLFSGKQLDQATSDSTQAPREKVISNAAAPSLKTPSKSFLCLFPFDCIRIHKGKQWRSRTGETFGTSLSMGNPWDALKVLLPDLGKGDNSFPEWLGFFGYEMGAFSDREKVVSYHSASTPECYLQRCAVVLSVDHSTNKGSVCIADQAEYFFEDEWRHWVGRLSEERCWSDLVKFANETDISEDHTNNSYALVTPPESFESYVSKIERIQEMIRAGDVYQINLSQNLEFVGKANSFSLFTKLARINPAPFSAYMQCKDFSIISSSPERFLCKTGDAIESRPIKGTAPRGSTLEQDASNRSSLMESSKEKAELLMITDLMRNDISKVSLPGTTQTPLIWGCEEYTNVFHLNSIISAQLQPNMNTLDAIRACFPGGSITGCPKLNAMEVIAQIENRPRGIYTGSIGYFAYNGDFDFNIAIRTFVATEEGISVQLGGGIVIDSDPQKEYEETLHKGQSIFKALGIELPAEVPVATV